MTHSFSLMPTLLVMAGGATGAALRYHLGRWLFHITGPGVPWGTFAANILGGFAMGILVGVLAHNDTANEPWRLLLGVGLLGGFTTFSAFSLETFRMIETGQWGMASVYAVSCVILSVLALFLGLYLVRSFA